MKKGFSTSNRGRASERKLMDDLPDFTGELVEPDFEAAEAED